MIFSGQSRLLINFIFSLVFLLSIAPSPSYPSESTLEKELFKMSLEELMNIKMVSAGKKAEKISEIPASVVVITRDDIERYGYRSLSEILENVPGMYSIDDWTIFGNNFGVRGFWNDLNNRNIVFLVNGVKQIDEYTSMNNILGSMCLQVEAIDRIEVVRGPMSVLYGSGAFYGVINIITDNVEDEPSNILSSAYGTNNTYKLVARISGNENDIKYSFNGSIYNSDGPNIELSKVSSGLSGNTKDEMTEKLFQVNFSGSVKGFYLNISNDASDVVHPFLVAPSNNFDPRSTSQTSRVAFGYKKKISDNYSIDAKINNSNSHLYSIYDFGFGADAQAFENINSQAYDVEVINFIYPSPKLDITAGINYHVIFNTYTEYDLPDNDFTNRKMSLNDNNNIADRSFYTQVKYLISKRVQIFSGVRFEQQLKYSAHYRKNASVPGAVFSRRDLTFNEDEPINIIPRFAAIYSLNERNVFKLLFGEAINRPYLYQRESSLTDSTAKEVEPETIETFELNYSSILSSELSISFSYFYNIMDKLIQRSIDINTNTLLWSNTGEKSTYGAEIQVQVKPSNSLFFDVAATFQDVTDNANEDIEVAFSPQMLGYLKASYRINEDMIFALTGNYVGKMESQWDAALDTTTHLPKGRIGDTADGYMNLGCNFRVENILSEGVYINIRCSNILDTDIYYPINSNQAWPTKGTMGIGRTFLASVGLKF